LTQTLHNRRLDTRPLPNLYRWVSTGPCLRHQEHVTFADGGRG
jgi:hypothetical protein